MKFPKQFQLHKAASTERKRYAMHLVQVNPDGTCVATDGRILAVVPAEPSAEDDIPDGGRLVPADAFRAACRYNSARNPTAAVTLNGTIAVHARPDDPRAVFEPEADGLEFPRWQAVVPAENPKRVRLSLNPQFLQRLADAIGASEGVTLEFEVSNKIGRETHPGPRCADAPIRVTPIDAGTDSATGAYGVIMPIVLSKR